jgi:hypothetical protein
LNCELNANSAKGDEKAINDLKYLTFILSVFETFLTAAVANTDELKANMIAQLRQARTGKNDDEDDRFKQLMAALKGDLSNKLVNIVKNDQLQ